MNEQYAGITPFDCKQALEALRSGVPNKEAVRILGCNQPQVVSRFIGMLDKAEDAENPPENSLGMLVSGEFGTGKSHLLAHLEDAALSRGFVCSKVAISKETPLYDLGKVFKSAVENGRVPNRSGRLVEELGLATKFNSPDYSSFFLWANEAATAQKINQVFPASLMVYERVRDPDITNKIEAFWAGDRLKVSEIKDGLKQIGQLQSYSFRAPKASDLPPQRLRFLTELIKGSGYKGWVILLDEIELVGSYSLLQRGRSYAELARWLGKATTSAYPGVVAVGTVTVDFASAIISVHGKKDLDNVGPRLRSRYDGDAATRAELGMKLLEREDMTLNHPGFDDVNYTIDKLREIYSTAYDWDAPQLEARTGTTSDQNRMRYRVRAAINQWDLLRLFPDIHPETEVDEFHYTYDEDTDLEIEAKDDPDDFQ